MRFLLLISSCLLAVSLHAQDNFRITIQLDKDIEDSLVLVYKKQKYQAMPQNRQAVMEGRVDEITHAHISLSSSNCIIPLFLEPSEIQIEAKIFYIEGRPCITYKKISGSKSNDLMTDFDDEVEKIKKKYVDHAAKEKIREMTTRLINEQSNTPLALSLLYRTYDYLDPEWAIQTLKSIQYPIDSSNYEFILSRIQGKINLQTGNYLNFTQLTPDSSEFSLSSLKGQYVLIDFWASWCRPCREENPKLKKLYETYKNKGLEIVGVSLDSKKEKWMEAIEKDELTWIHVSDLKGWKNEIAMTLGINSIPTTILLDPNGYIIDFSLRGKSLEKRLKKLLN